MKKQILTAAIAIMAIGASAQEKVRVHNGTQSFVTEIEYITFDATEADQAISVDDLQKENTQLSTEKAALEADTATLKATNTKLESFLKEKLLYDDYVDYVPILHESVDLGLSVKWATMNVGATKPEDYGAYIAWGETKTKSEYNWDTYIVEQGSFIGDNKTVLDPEDDAAAANWGGDWAMPSEADWSEIYNNCTYEWTTQNGVNGYKITGTNGNSIFLPAAGYRYYGDLLDEGSLGYYWLSSLIESGSNCGRYLYFEEGFFSPWFNCNRYVGFSVRPVCPSAGNTNGYVAVDLGLPSGKLWADCNVGASTPEASGDYFAWGETEAKENYCWRTYKHMQSGKSEWYYINKYQVKDGQFDAVWYKNVKYQNNGGKTVLDAADDAATASWGGKWRMPTADEWEELYDNTTQTWTNDYEGTGIKGYIITSTKEGYEGASIFLPAAGYRSRGVIYNDGPDGYYWSSSLYEYGSSNGRGLHFYERLFNPWTDPNRCNGLSVRPVCKP